jgi:hypothetical protein
MADGTKKKVFRIVHLKGSGVAGALNKFVDKHTIIVDYRQFYLTCYQTFVMRNKILFNDYLFFSALVVAFVLQLIQPDEANDLTLSAIASASTIFRIIIYTMAVALVLYIIWSLIILPVRVLRAIAKDNAITELNIRDLAIIGWSLIFFAVLPGLIALLFNYIFSDSIRGGSDLFIPDIFSKNKGLVAAAIIVLVFRKAIKKGYLFRKANEITI